ncbi:hypothetical protein ACT1U9_32880 (plasmid) [Streptomyces sp. BR1]|uniref:hypothetical protein n=1 Tax=Streptomyces sp. BR1 TaxID=1592323 RepID=UPI00402B302D
MGSFLDEAKAAQDEKREKDPADMSGSKDPWATNDGAGEGGGDVSDSASGNAGDPADENEETKPKPPRKKAGPTRTPALRRGRPKGPERRPLSTRILPELDRTLTKAVEVTGKNPQTLVEEALASYFRRLKIEDPGESAEEADVA